VAPRKEDMVEIFMADGDEVLKMSENVCREVLGKNLGALREHYI
jgi:hypothetical protein